MPTSSRPASPKLTPALLLLMAIATGIAVASNYYAQPLLRTLSVFFNVSETAAATIVTTAQFSYALGLIFLTPLGDILERKKLIIVMMLLSTSGLIISATAQNIWILLLGTGLAGLFSVVAQVLIPFASMLTKPEERGKVVGTLMSGLLVGILLARAFAGTISTLSDWRMVYTIAAILMLGTTILLAIYLPRSQSEVKINYGQLILSIVPLFFKYPVLRLRSLIGCLIFSNFAILWTPLAYLLHDHYHYSDFTIGLFGLIGAAAAFITPLAGKYSDLGKAQQVSTSGLLILILSWAAIYYAPSSIFALIIGILLLDIAVQFVHVLNMSEIYKLDQGARSRINASYIFSYFLGGTIGSVSSAFAYQQFQWAGVCIYGTFMAVLTLIVWLTGRQV